MAEIIGLETGLDLPGFAASRIGFYILLALGILFFAIVLAGVIWWFYRKKIYRYEIVVFENISGDGWRVAMKDKAKLLRLSNDGTEVLYLKKKKMPLTAYGKKMGRNQYWFAIGQDGGYYNFVLGDLDAKMGMLDIELIDRDIKYASAAMRRNTAENYGKKETFMDKYGSWVFGGVTIFILIFGIWFLLDKMGDIATQLAGASNAFAQTAEPIQQALARVDSICSGGTGIQPAT